MKYFLKICSEEDLRTFLEDNPYGRNLIIIDDFTMIVLKKITFINTGTFQYGGLHLKSCLL